jgi:hypothetical protein
VANYTWETSDDKRRDSPSCGRNRGPILEVLREILPAAGESAGGNPAARPLVLEIASGTGQHAVFMAENLPHLDWQPSDMDPGLRDSIVAWNRHASPPGGLPNVFAPLDLDVTAADWGFGAAEAARLAAIVNANMIHISPWRAAEGLMAGAGRLLPRGGRLFLYGPFKRGGSHTAPSNADFDRSLRSRNPDWGVRDLDDVEALAGTNGLDLRRTIEMPANNLSVIFEKG